jgi:hypothetical protein
MRTAARPIRLLGVLVALTSMSQGAWAQEAAAAPDPFGTPSPETRPSPALFEGPQDPGAPALYGGPQAEPVPPLQTAPAPSRPPLPSPEQPRERSLLALAYFGFNVTTGDTFDGYGTGLDVGTLIGYRLGRRISLNGELSVDLLRPRDDGNVAISDFLLGVGLSPLVHLGPPDVNLDIVIGPRVGYFKEWLSASYRTMVYPKADMSYTGFAWGLNVGAFFWLRRVIALGGLIRYASHAPSHYCEASSRTAYLEVCQDGDGPDRRLFTVDLAVMY